MVNITIHTKPCSSSCIFSFVKVTIRTPSNIRMHAITFLSVMGSCKNKIPMTILVIGSNNPTMLVTAGILNAYHDKCIP